MHSLFAGLLLISLLCSWQVDGASLFDGDSVLDVKLTGPLTSLFADKKQRAEQPFTLVANGKEHAVKVRLRGKSRLRVCNFPPLRLNFSRQDTADTVFAGQDKVKLVTHCRKRKASQVDAIQEYAAYRLLSVLTDVAYRVRLLRITYIDTERHDKDQSSLKYAFVIEPKKALAKRVGGQLTHVKGVTLGSLDAQHMAIVYVFQYLIGNTDWSLVTADDDDECCHNGDLLDIGQVRYYVPYDFDLAGLVNARYSNPDPSLRIKKVTQRLYRGFCMPQTNVQTALETILKHESDIMGIMRGLPGLSPKELDSSSRYLQKFFTLAGNKEKLLRTFKKQCLRAGS
ncbi:MAG: hypothetical protein HKN70_11550 [Gammaproteobacteria bacterium]|nr:hypothetical protein [Gammaproteobacteria bacterium]